MANSHNNKLIIYPNLILLQYLAVKKTQFRGDEKNCFSSATKCLTNKRKYMHLYSFFGCKINFNLQNFVDPSFVNNIYIWKDDSKVYI